MWIILTIYLLIIAIYFSIKLKFKNFKINIKELFKRDKTSLFLTLGTKIGVGSIIGTTSSILIGGFSSVIWIILFSFIFSSIIYYESYYGNKYKKNNNNEYVGGPYFIFKYGLNDKVLAIISLILLIILYSFLFQMIQFNTISYALINYLNISKTIIIIVSSIILFITLSLSVKNILNLMNKIVPYMCLLFIVTSLYIILKNINLLNIELFIKDITNIKSILCGLVIGIKRSIFMNETLIGTTSTTSASDKNNIEVSIKYQILSTYFISIIITLLVTFLLLVYLNENTIITDYNELLFNIFNTNKYGALFLIIIYILFGFTTVLSGYYIGINNIEYLTNKKIYLIIFKILFIISCVFGIILNNNYIWKYTDIFIFIMIIINSYSIIKLVMFYDRK
ncbi:MAG: alanine:cation symporter family protein [Bacilli bacterium]|nr:alanine:cation symporter family protein [Bacilli bacterium]